MRGLATLFILASALVVTPTYSDEGTTLKGPKGVDYGAQGRSIGPIKPSKRCLRTYSILIDSCKFFKKRR